MARIPETKSERDGHRLLSKKAALALPIPLSYLTISDLKFPILRLRDWAADLADKSLFCGLRSRDPKREGDILDHFWKSFRALHPQHQVFLHFEAGQACPRSTYPVLFHRDEGRGRRRLPFLVTNFHPILGRGTQIAMDKLLQTGTARPHLKLLPNVLGDSRTTRFLHSAVPKKLLDKAGVWDAVMQSAAEESEFMMQVGCPARGTQIRMCVLYTCGDWAFLHKSGNLSRSFADVRCSNEAIGNLSQVLGRSVGHSMGGSAPTRPLVDANAFSQRQPFPLCPPCASFSTQSARKKTSSRGICSIPTIWGLANILWVPASPC